MSDGSECVSVLLLPAGPLTLWIWCWACFQSFRVMSFIEKSVARLDQPERLEALAVELGKSHYHYNAPPKYYNVRSSSSGESSSHQFDFNIYPSKSIWTCFSLQYVGAEFICAVQPILKEQWTTELEKAWKVNTFLLIHSFFCITLLKLLCTSAAINDYFISLLITDYLFFFF